MTFTNWRFTCLPLKSAGVQHRQGIQQTTFLWNGGFRLSRWYDFFLDFVNNVNSVVLIFVTETISRTDEGQPKMKYIFIKCGTSIYFFYSTEFGPSPSPNFKYRLWNKVTESFPETDFLISLFFYLSNPKSHTCNISNYKFF